jgi:hypothetical protein
MPSRDRFSRQQPHLTSAAIARKTVATVLTLAAVGLMGLATFGRFDDATDTGTRSVVPAEAAGR